MTRTHRYHILTLLALSSILLASLIPGGPIEHRDFSHINPGILATFNLFLTILNLGTIVLLYFVYKQKHPAISTAFVVALGYFLVYALDLAQIFPRSPTPMSQSLALVEVLGLCTAVPLMFLCLQQGPLLRYRPNLKQFGVWFTNSTQLAGTERNPLSGVRVALAILFILAGIAIVLFSTDSAINSATALMVNSDFPDQ